MCTTISSTASIRGAGKGADGWFPVTQSVVAFDHPGHTGADHALLLDFANFDLATCARVGVEMDLASGKALLQQLQNAIEAAETSGLRG